MGLTALFTPSPIQLHTRGIIKFYSTANEIYNFHRLSNKNEGHPQYGNLGIFTVEIDHCNVTAGYIR